MAAVARARAWLFDLFTHHHAERLRTERAVVRKAHGVQMSDLPYPGSTSESGNRSTVNNARGYIAGGLLGAALLAAGALGLSALKPSAPAPTPPAASSPGQAWDAVTEVQQPDGSWKTVKREPLKIP